MMCRLVDDYLFVTTEESKARKFLDMMNAGQSHLLNRIMCALNGRASCLCVIQDIQNMAVLSLPKRR